MQTTMQEKGIFLTRFQCRMPHAGKKKFQNRCTLPEQDNNKNSFGFDVKNSPPTRAPRPDAPGGQGLFITEPTADDMRSLWFRKTFTFVAPPASAEDLSIFTKEDATMTLLRLFRERLTPVIPAAAALVASGARCRWG